jgi:hypothetical protein
MCSKVSAAGATPTAYAAESTPSSQPSNRRGDQEAGQPHHLVTTAHDGAQTKLSAPAEPAGRREPDQHPEHDHNDDHDQDGLSDTRAETSGGSRATIGYCYEIQSRQPCCRRVRHHGCPPPPAQPSCRTRRTQGCSPPEDEGHTATQDPFHPSGRREAPTALVRNQRPTSVGGTERRDLAVIGTPVMVAPRAGNDGATGAALQVRPSGSRCTCSN